MALPRKKLILPSDFFPELRLEDQDPEMSLAILFSKLFPPPAFGKGCAFRAVTWSLKA